MTGEEEIWHSHQRWIWTVRRNCRWSITAFVITDEDGRNQTYLYKSGDLGVSFPVSPNFGSSESEFQWPDLDVTQFAGWVTVAGGSGGAGSGTRMTWVSGQAQGLEFVATGWSLSLQVGVSHGSFKPEGAVVNIGPRPNDWPIPRNTVAIWHPDAKVQPSQRQYTGRRAYFWGTLVLQHISGDTMGPSVL